MAALGHHTDNLLYKIIVLKEAKINTVSYNPEKRN